MYTGLDNLNIGIRLPLPTLVLGSRFCSTGFGGKRIWLTGNSVNATDTHLFVEPTKYGSARGFNLVNEVAGCRIENLTISMVRSMTQRDDLRRAMFLSGFVA